MHDNDKTMTSMKHNGKPIIDDEDTHVKSIELKIHGSILKRPTNFQTGDSGNIGQWKEEGVFIEEDRGDENSDREFSPISRNSPFVCSTNGLVAGKTALVTHQSLVAQKATVESITSTNKNGNYRKELPEPLNSSHSRYKTTDPNGNHGHVTSDHVTTTNISSENQEPISISSLPIVAVPATSNGEHGTANSSTETPPQSLPSMNTEEGQIDIPDERMPNDSEIMPMETSDTHLETRTVATPPQTTSEPSVSQVTDVTMEDIEPGTTTPARTPENAVTVEEQGLEEAQEGHEEMEVSISCTQEDSRPESEAILEEIKTEESKSEVKNISVEMADSSSTVTPGNLRLEDAQHRLENDNITNTLSALSVESRTADMIRRLVYIRARLMKPSSRIEAKKQKIRAQRERRHIPGICDFESKLICENRLTESDNDTPDTDESDIEDVDFMNDKIGSEQRRIRHREKLEEDKNRKIESRRTWLLKQIKNCERKETAIQSRFKKEEPNSFSDMVMDEMEEQDDGHCARTRAFVSSSKRLRIKAEPLESKPFESEIEVEKSEIKSRKYWHTNRPVPLAKTNIEKHSTIHRLDNSYHHMLSNPRSIPLSTRLSTVLHNLDPNQKAMELKKIAKRNERREKRVSNDKKRPKQRNEDFENNIVVPSSSFISNIVMPKYKNIDTPGYRSDETSDQSKEDEDEDISHESYVRRHIKAEKQEKLRYYQSAIKKSRKRKKEQIDPRLASPKPESYIIRESDDLSCGYRKIEYPIPLSQVGELGFKHEEVCFKKKKQKKQWRSSTTEGSGGLRLKLSLRKT